MTNDINLLRFLTFVRNDILPITTQSRKRESSNDFVVPRLREDSVWTPASVGVTGFLTFYETVRY
jgi:hypothetical protein